MLTATVYDLLSWHHCWPWISEAILQTAGPQISWSALDVLGVEKVLPKDRLWIVLRPQLIPEKQLDELACQFAEHVLPLFETIFTLDSRPRAAIAAKREWINGECSQSERDKAQEAARAAAWDADASARAAAAGAAWAASWAAVSAAEAAEGAAAWPTREVATAACVAAARAAWAAAREGEAFEAAAEEEARWQVDVVRYTLIGM